MDGGTTLYRILKCVLQISIIYKYWQYNNFNTCIKMIKDPMAPQIFLFTSFLP